MDTNPHDPVPSSGPAPSPSHQPPASSQPQQPAQSQRPGEHQESQKIRPARHRLSAPRAPRAAGAAVVIFLAVLVATAVFGVPAGYLWAVLAPRALAQVVSRGGAGLVNPETNAFIAADAWFALIAALGGLLTGVAGYLLVVRRRGAPAALGLILGGLAAAALMAWIGDNYGHAVFQHRLLTSPTGTRLHASLSLGSKGAILFWPVVAALVIAIPEAVAYFRGPSRPPPQATPATPATPTAKAPPAQTAPAPPTPASNSPPPTVRAHPCPHCGRRRRPACHSP